MRTEVVIIAFGTLAKEKTERKKKIEFLQYPFLWCVGLCCLAVCGTHFNFKQAYYLQYGYFR